MYLKSLEIQGFKSFSDKTVLDFKKGITAVVGPNGSGKSNIGDAMRWVMGEQSSKTLRGEKMNGVIFYGTQSRKKASFAQVTINIDNHDNALDFDSDVVSVSRKLYQNGDSEYLINGNDVRLKDVTELFLDTGLGRDGYSIIGQGRIADIVNGKSNERREIFEEAAGISKFRLKKEEAEKKLVAAEDNISRLNDILGELEERVEPLKEQSEKAKKFSVLDNEKRKLEVSVWVHKLEELSENSSAFEEKLSALNSQYEQLTSELEKYDDDISENFGKSAEKSEEIDKLRDKIHQVELDNSNALSEIAVCENDISHLTDNISQYREQVEQSSASKYYLETELEQRNKDLVKLEDDYKNALSASTDKQSEFEKLSEKAAKSDDNLNEVNTEINSVYLKKSELSFKIENGKNNADDLQSQLSDAVENQQDNDKTIKLSVSELNQLKTAKAKADELKEECTNRYNGMVKLRDTKKEKLEACRKEYSDTDVSLREINSKLNILNDLENSMEGFAYSVKSVMKASKQGRISGVCGSVAQLINVKSEYSVAIETALGGALQNVIVENEDSAKRCIKFLKENKAGRATFLPVTTVKGKAFDFSNAENCNGFVASAAELVTYDSKYKDIVSSLLGRICIAEDIDCAAKIAAKNGYRFKICTLDGQVVNAGGSFTGGSVSKNTGILTRKNEIETAESKKKKLEEKFQMLSDKKERLSQEAANLEAESDGLKDKIGNASNDCLRFEMEIKRVSELCDKYNQTNAEIQTVIETVKNKIIDNQNDIDNANSELKDVEERISECEQKLSKTQEEQDILRQKRENISSKLSQMKVAEAELQKDIEACRLSAAQLEQTINTNADDREKLEQNIAECEKNIKNKNVEIEKIRSGLTDADSVVETINKEIEVAQRQHLEFDNLASSLREKQKSVQNEKENLSGQITRTDEQNKTVTEKYDKLVSQLWDDYELTRTAATEISEKIDDLTAANSRLSELRNMIKKLGNVNLGAIEEYKQVSERYEFMTKQLGDVNTSKLELEKMIDELTENMKSVFISAFENINRNFKEIFNELFGGGKAELVLADMDNVLECGIDINVAPPGKVITNLLSLSGGEQALVAISIYFSILKLSPSPFCLLDEIEAALDDVNVSKYAQYLHRLTDKTQFITITHRRGTMEEADVLYGVTMQEKGISKLLKMDVSDTAQMKLE